MGGVVGGLVRGVVDGIVGGFVGEGLVGEGGRWVRPERKKGGRWRREISNWRRSEVGTRNFWQWGAMTVETVSLKVGVMRRAELMLDGV